MLVPLETIKPARSRLIIINVSTKWVSTLALLSAKRYTSSPILLVDCESTDGSVDHFSKLQREYEFDLASLPLRPHGQTLDFLFKNLKDDQIWLLDSDAEILSPLAVEIMTDAMSDERVFGSGFVHAYEWLPRSQTGFRHPRIGLYHERMWIPFTLLKRPVVAAELALGESFMDRAIYNDFPPLPKLSRFLHRRKELPFLSGLQLAALNPFKAAYGDRRPSYVYMDTGASLYRTLKLKKELIFSGLDARVSSKYVAHYHGVTRALLNPADTNASQFPHVLNSLYSRLRSEYGINPTDA